MYKHVKYIDINSPENIVYLLLNMYTEIIEK